MTLSQDVSVLPRVSLRRDHIADTAVAVIEVVPMHEVARPFTCVVQARQSLVRELGPVLGCAKQTLHKCVVIAHPRPGVRGLDAQPVQHGDDGGGFDGRAVVAVQHRSLISLVQGNAFGQCRAMHQMRGVLPVIFGVNLPPHDLAAVEVQDQVQVEPLAHHLGGQVGHVPAPHLPRGGGHMRLRRAFGLRCLGAPTVGVLPGLSQDAAEGRFTGQVDALIGQHGHDACWWHVRKSRLVGRLQYSRTLGRRERMGRCGVDRIRATIALCQPILGFPALQRAQTDARELASLAQASALAVRFIDDVGHVAAIFQSDHSSSPLWKIASSFFDSTSSAAVSARALSLRRSSRSSALMRLRSAAVSLGLARCSSGVARAWVALARQASSSCGYTPFSRHQALRLDSSMAAVVLTALSRADADQARWRAGLVRDSALQRSRVSTDTPSSNEMSSKEAVFGGSSLASTLFLKACPYRAITSFHQRPPFFQIYGGDKYSDVGGGHRDLGADATDQRLSGGHQWLVPSRQASCSWLYTHPNNQDRDLSDRRSPELPRPQPSCWATHLKFNRAKKKQDGWRAAWRWWGRFGRGWRLPSR